jgi:hypothetical protein
MAQGPALVNEAAAQEATPPEAANVAPPPQAGPTPGPVLLQEAFATC